ncbi:MAG: SDR family NAD(P)-dependent oxidoreductase [Rhizomicrobium sp.]
MKDVRGKTAFITGGASGMGLGMATVFAEAGMKVVIADVREAALAEAMKTFDNTNLAVPAGPARRHRPRPLGPGPPTRRRSISARSMCWRSTRASACSARCRRRPTKDWDFNLSVNIGGVANGLVTFLPRMLAHGEEGHVVTTSSSGGFSAVGGAGLYCTAKFAVAGTDGIAGDRPEGAPRSAPRCSSPARCRPALGMTTQ